MLATATSSQTSPLFSWKYPSTSPPTPPIVHIRAISKPKPTTTPLSQHKHNPMTSPRVDSTSRRALSTPESSDQTPEPAQKRKKSDDPNDVSNAAPRRARGKSRVKADKSTSRATSTPNRPPKRAGSTRSSSRRESEEPADCNYTPPPKRARSHHPFGSMEGPVPRACFAEQDGNVDQCTARDVVQGLLHTYKSYFHNPADKSDNTWEIVDGCYPCVYLEYPNDHARERYALLVPKDPQHYNPIMELMDSLQVIVKHYVPPHQQAMFGTLTENCISSSLNESPPHINDAIPNLLQRLRQAEHHCDGPRFTAALDQINRLLWQIKRGEAIDCTIESYSADSGSPLSFPTTWSLSSRAQFPINYFTPNINPITKPNPFRETVKTWSGVPVGVWNTILSETYQRCIGPSVPMLREYTPHSSETYGELEANFISDIVHQCGVTPTTKFLDLGSGVGNVALQLSLQVGCETYGIELREPLDHLARKQQDELQKRCRLWGVTASGVELEQGDFRNSERTREKLKDADVVLVNNFKFGPDLNASLTNMFLDMREGAIVVTLIPLLPENFRISIHTMYNPLAIFEQEEREYHRGSVSWSNVGGKYFIHRINREHLRQFDEKNSKLIAEATRRSKYQPGRNGGWD